MSSAAPTTSSSWCADAGTGSRPSGLVDVRLEDGEGLPGEIREAGTALLQELRRSGSQVAVAVVPGTPRVQLVAIEVLAIRRRPPICALDTEVTRPATWPLPALSRLRERRW
jgi:hypothetical protein